MADDNMTYTASLAELEEILRKIQSPDCDIDKLSAYTTRALELLKFCKDKLTKTDEEIKKSLEALS